MSERINAKQLSELLKISPKSVSYAVKNGMIDNPGSDGKFDKEAAIKQYNSNKTDSNTFSVGQEAASVSYDDQFPTIAESKQKKAYYDALLSKINADRAQMDYDQSRKLLIDKKQLADKLKKNRRDHKEPYRIRANQICCDNIR